MPSAAPINKGGRIKVLTLLERFAQYYTPLTADECWLWEGAITGEGYGAIIDHRKLLLAHRISYETHKGDIPSGLELDHKCRVRRCINPNHLEPVTHKVNMERGLRASKTHCPKGHPYAGENLYIDKRGKRYCRTCWRERRVNCAVVR